MQTHRTVDGAPTPESPDATPAQVASGAAALGASSDRPSRQQPSRHGATAQGRHRGAHQRIPERAPAEHDRRPRQGIERRPRQGRRRAVAHRQGHGRPCASGVLLDRRAGARVGIRSQRGLLGVHVLAHDRGAARGERGARPCPRRRRRRDVEHHRLQGPRDVRAVRRRRRRGGRIGGAAGRAVLFSTSSTRSTARGGPALCMPAGGSARAVVARERSISGCTT